jgi:O-antigen ligase
MNKTLYVYKSMRVVSNYRQQAIFIVIICSLIALFVSRAALSISMIALVALTCVHAGFAAQVKKFVSDFFLMGMACLFLIPLFTGLWSEDIHEWAGVLRLKLPLLFLPLAFAGSWQLKNGQWKTIAIIFISVVFAGTVWSMWQYMEDPAATEKYLRAKVFATPLSDDHIRFSWLVSVAILIIALLWKHAASRFKIILFISGLWLVIYLHVLSARTGLACFYIMLGYFFVQYVFVDRSVKKSVISLALLVVLPTIAWFFVPSFRNRILYFNYDFSYVKRAVYLPGANDGNRFLSIRAGLDVMKQHPLGVGAGDVEHAVFNWYDTNVPGMLPTDRIYPSSEWLVYGIMAGWPGMLVFTIIMALPFFVKNIHNRFAWVCLQSTAAFSLMFDVGLEVQYGIFTYAIIVLWWWKWFKAEKV